MPIFLEQVGVFRKDAINANYFRIMIARFIHFQGVADAQGPDHLET
jgi:hypothetical protein